MARRVLLIDDSDLIRDFFVRYLPEQGMECATAATGAEGMRLFRTWRTNVVLLDVGLPDCCGLDLLREMQQEAECPPVIVCSAWPDAVSAAVRFGAAEALLKPFMPKMVLEAINRVCQ